MAPNIKDQLPILKQIIQYFKKDGIILDSPLFKLHNQMSCMMIGMLKKTLKLPSTVDRRTGTTDIGFI